MGVGFFFFFPGWLSVSQSYFGEFYWQPNHLQHPEILTRRGVIQVIYHPALQVTKLSAPPCFWAHIPASLHTQRLQRYKEMMTAGIPTASWHTLTKVCWSWGSSTVSSRMLTNKSQAVTGGSGLNFSMLQFHLTNGNNNSTYLRFNFWELNEYVHVKCLDLCLANFLSVWHSKKP